MAEQFYGTSSNNKLKEKINALEDTSTNGAIEGNTRSEICILSSIMKIDRYYSSVKEALLIVFSKFVSFIENATFTQLFQMWWW